MSIHPTAIIAADVKLGDNVSVGAYSVIADHVEIGSGTVIGPHVVINGPTKIGSDNRIFQFASIGDAPQDKKYNGEPTELVIGDRNVFRECCTINRGTITGHGVTRIGSDNRSWLTVMLRMIALLAISAFSPTTRDLLVMWNWMIG